MAELVDATDLKSVEDFPRAGSIPAFRTTFKLTLWKQRVFLCFFLGIFAYPSELPVKSPVRPFYPLNFLIQKQPFSPNTFGTFFAPKDACFYNTKNEKSELKIIRFIAECLKFSFFP